MSQVKNKGFNVIYFSKHSEDNNSSTEQYVKTKLYSITMTYASLLKTKYTWLSSNVLITLVWWSPRGAWASHSGRRMVLDIGCGVWEHCKGEEVVPPLSVENLT